MGSHWAQVHTPDGYLDSWQALRNRKMSVCFQRGRLENPQQSPRYVPSVDHNNRLRKTWWLEAMQVTQVGRARSQDQVAVDLRDMVWLLGTSFVPAAYKHPGRGLPEESIWFSLRKTWAMVVTAAGNSGVSGGVCVCTCTLLWEVHACVHVCRARPEVE